LIIPVHNAEKYLEACLDCAINQTYDNIEIILVNDNSTDKSHDIIKKYLKVDKRIKYLEVNNNNAALTRREGIKKSTAEYLCFLDSDDLIDKEYVKLLYDALVSTDSEISTGKITAFYSDRNTSKKPENLPDTNTTSIENNLLSFFCNNYHWTLPGGFIPQSINAKMFNKSLFDGIDYSVIKTSILEDNFVLAQVFKNSKRNSIALTDTTIYYYRLGHSSTMSNTLSKQIKYGNSQIDYPDLFSEAMDYIKNLYRDRDNIEYYTYKLKAQEYYSIAKAVVQKSIEIENLQSVNADLLKTNTDLSETNADLLKTNNEISNRYESIMKSYSFRFGKWLLLPLRIVRIGLQRFKNYR
jgi:glycosyltransferase involved in cell wall biosynthesis